MINIGIYFGSSTGDTKKIAYLIKKEINKFYNVKIFNISKVDLNEFKKNNIFILGASTWYNGEIQHDWNNFLVKLKKIDFSKKIVSLFGCGDQVNYSKTFGNGLSVLYNIVKNNKANVIGYWSTDGYNFLKSKSLLNKEYFLGLLLDENNQSMLSVNRVCIWVKKLIFKIRKEYKIN